MTHDLFTYADSLPAHQAHSDTSRAAAEEIKMHVGPMHRAILDHLDYLWVACCLKLGAGEPGATDEEMQRNIPMPQNSQRPRRRELQQAGLIADSGKTRATESGRQAVVWVLAPASPSHPDERAGKAT